MNWTLSLSGRVGSTTPRLFTAPLVTGPAGECGCGCALTRADTLGFDVADFADQVLSWPLLPWQRWLVIHAMEHTEGIPRFRTVLVLVARQNGKTELLKVLALYWLYIQRVALVLGTSTNLDYAKESWQKAVDVAEGSPVLRTKLHARDGVRRANGEQTLKTKWGSRYKIAAANRTGGRSLTVHRLICDELREHKNWDAWGAAYNAMIAIPDAQAWALSNAGEDDSVVLNQFRASALAGAEQIGLFEWSALESADLDDIDAIAQANPSLGFTLTESAIKAARESQPPAVYRTENMCIKVTSLNQAITLESWQGCYDEGTLPTERKTVSLCLDVSPDLSHASLAAAVVLPSGKTRVEIVGSWNSTQALRDELPDLVARIKPRTTVYPSGGPAAALMADLKLLKATPLQATEVIAACMGFVEQVSANQILHSGDDLLTAHVAGSSKLYSGDGFRFTRKGSGNVDALYAAAGAVHSARTQKPSSGKPRILVATS